MKKIININLSGRVIPIEDSAYEHLQGYIESLRRYFAHEESRDEIINDIESRIAELMSEKVRKGAACITDADVDEIAGSMGRPEDFEAEAATAGDIPLQGSQQQQQSYQQSSAQPEKEKKPRGRLYRDTSDKFIGGVCSGIAAYMNVDPAIVRILFAIVTFGGFGLGFLAYIIMWMVLPPKDLDEYGGKRLFRNPEDRVIGGVAGGLAAYFGKSSSTIRLIFAAPLILNIIFSSLKGFRWHYDFDLFWNIGFSSITGTFILVYIILWIVLPEATTPYQKMEMRGEKVDVNTIRQNVKEGMDSMKDKMKGWTEEVKSSAQQFGEKAKEFGATRGKEFAREVNETARRTGGGLGHAIGVLFKVFFLFIFGTIAFALFVSLIALLFSGVQWWPVNNFLWTSKWQQIYAWGTLLFFLVVPLVAFIVWVVRRIIRARSGSNYLGWTFGALWTIGWISMILLASSISHDLSSYKSVDTEVTLTQPVKGKMILAVSQPKLEYTGGFGWISDEADGWDISADTMKLSTVRFNFEASTDSFYHVYLKKYSYGRTDEEAKTRAAKIEYSAVSRDSVLDLASGYRIDKSSKFRLQQVEIYVQVPVGKKIRFDASIREKLNPMRFTVGRRYKRNRLAEVRMEDDYSFDYSTGVDYTMGIDGKLKGDYVKEVRAERRYNNDYRYNAGDSVEQEELNNKIQQQLDEEKRKREESDRKIKELEEKQKAGKPVVQKIKRAVDTEGAIVGIPSPVSSLVL
ncbi:MAG: PspC domain-containing protein [Sphingobacteriales bacterium]|nr:PspC domain-containing protein [Sphingobacteriales bacterium]